MIRADRPTRFTPLAAAALMALALLVGGACSNGDDDAAGGSTPTSTTVAVATTAPPGRPPGAVDTGLAEVGIGDCFDTIGDPAVSDRVVWTLDCEMPHGYEVYDVVTYEGDGAGRGTSYPGAATVQDWAEQACYDRFEAFVGVRWTISELDISVWWPSEESWARADRTVICAVTSDTGDELTGTQRGIGR